MEDDYDLRLLAEEMGNEELSNKYHGGDDDDEYIKTEEKKVEIVDIKQSSGYSDIYHFQGKTREEVTKTKIKDALVKLTSNLDVSTLINAAENKRFFKGRLHLLNAKILIISYDVYIKYTNDFKGVLHYMDTYNLSQSEKIDVLRYVKCWAN